MKLSKSNKNVLQMDLPRILCRKIDTTAVVNGQIDKSIWNRGDYTENFYKLRKTDEQPQIKPSFSTRAGFLWDDEYLYVSFECESDDVWAAITTRDSELWNDPVVEIFIDPAGEGKSFFEFQVNPIGTIYDSYVPDSSQSKDWRRWCQWDCEGLIVETSVDGRLNEREYKDNGWSAKFAIPFESLRKETGISPRAGDVWRLNLSRYERSRWLDEKELSCWAPVVRVFDDLQRFGYMQFV